MAALAQTQNTQYSFDDKQQILTKVAQDLLKIGEKLYNERLFEQAEDHLQRAKRFEGYLDDKQRIHVVGLLRASQAAAVQKKNTQAHIKRAQWCMNNQQLIIAKNHYEQAVKSNLLTRLEQNKAEQAIAKIQQVIHAQKDKIDRLYASSVDAYKEGRYAEAKEGFEQVSQSGLCTKVPPHSPEDYLAKIDKVGSFRLVARNEQSKPKTVEVAKDTPTVTLSDGTRKTFNTRPISKPVNAAAATDNRKLKIIRSYVDSLHARAMNKVPELIEQARFSQAQELADQTLKAIEQKKPYISKPAYQYYQQQLQGLIGTIQKERKAWLGQ